jgi:hypothetical protein
MCMPGHGARQDRSLGWERVEVDSATYLNYLPTCLGFSWLLPVVVVVGFFFFVFLSFLVYPDVL